MPTINYEIENKKINKKYIIFLFILITLLIPFSESKKVLLWNYQRNQENINPFAAAVNIYALQSENIKKSAGLTNFFREEGSFWVKIKNFPVVHSPIVTFNDQDVLYKNIQETTSVDNQNKPNQDKSNQDEEPVYTGNNTDNTTTSSNDFSNATISAPYSFLLIGDSFMGVYAAVGDLLEKSLLNYKDVEVNRFGKVSSGLSRPDFFNWNEKAEELIKLYKPNIVIIMMGTNDAQSLSVINQDNQKKYLTFGSDKWQEEYGNRVSIFIKIFVDNKITVFWTGLPIMREKNFSERMKLINSIYEKQINNFENSYFISTWELLGDKEGNYAAFLTDKNGQNRATRVSDGIHLTFFAGNIVIEKILGQIKNRIILEPVK